MSEPKQLDPGSEEYIKRCQDDPFFAQCVARCVRDDMIDALSVFVLCVESEWRPV